MLVIDEYTALQQGQDLFRVTGGLHAAGLFDARGRRLALAEDVGRHNAVDKVIGEALRFLRPPLAGAILMVSGRAGFEIVHKARRAGIPVVCSVSAPSSLAVRLARDGGLYVPSAWPRLTAAMLADLAGLKREISAITDRAMRGELDFAAALLQRVAMLKGLGESALEETFQTRIRLNAGARTLVQTMKKSGACAALVSGGFTFFVARVAEMAGFDVVSANDLIIEGGVLTGDVARPIHGRKAKLEALRSIARERGIGQSDTLAVGDGANDLDMLAEAGLGVAYRAKPSVAAAAQARVDHGDLTALLYAQGYRRDEFVE